ncbi:MAG: hypothetical protein OEM05_16200, partial [Myxococcales bacterium]|nr:hypothetical protein [Myxococcales bacterium]
LALPLAAALACGGEKTTIETDEGTVTVDRDDQTVTFSAGDEIIEMKTGERVELPKDFPKDVPVYPSATILTSMTSPEGIMVASRSTADAAEVVAFYKKTLVGEGWTVEGEMNMGPQHIISFAKGDRQVTVTAASDEGETQISLMAAGG